MGARSMRQSVPISEARLAMRAALQNGVAEQMMAPDLRHLLGPQMANSFRPVPPQDDRLERAVETIENLTDALAKATGVEVDA